jgi:aspartate racemase
MQSLSSFHHLVGIIGGVGPEATNYFTSLLVKMRGNVQRDQDHIPFLLFNNPQIPDRSGYLLYNQENPVPEMVQTGLFLKRAGATFLVIPCNTAHAFTQEIEKGVGLPVMSMVDLTVQYIVKTYGNDVTVGLLGTNGTVHSKIYQETFAKIAPDISVLVPEEKSQTNVMKAIYEIKSFSVNEQNKRLLSEATEELKKRGATIIILGCTEIPLALPKEACDFERIDPMEVLAEKVIAKTLQSAFKIPQKLTNFFSAKPLSFQRFLSYNKFLSEKKMT